jgi:hypothetical protein
MRRRAARLYALLAENEGNLKMLTAVLKSGVATQVACESFPRRQRSRRRFAPAPRGALHNTASAQLVLLTSQLTSFTATVLPKGNISSDGKTILTGTDDMVSVSTNMLDTLRQMLVGVNATAFNTQVSAFKDSGAHGRIGTFASGGWITGGIPNMDSVRLASGDIGMPGEFIIRKQIAQRDAAWLPDYNRTGTLPESNVIPFRNDAPAALPPANVHQGNGIGEVVSEIRALHRTIETQGKEIKELHAKIANATLRGADAAVRHVSEKLQEVVGDAGKRVANEIRMNKLDNRIRK